MTVSTLFFFVFSIGLLLILSWAAHITANNLQAPKTTRSGALALVFTWLMLGAAVFAFLRTAELLPVVL